MKIIDNEQGKFIYTYEYRTSKVMLKMFSLWRWREWRLRALSSRSQKAGSRLEEVRNAELLTPSWSQKAGSQLVGVDNDSVFYSELVPGSRVSVRMRVSVF